MSAPMRMPLGLAVAGPARVTELGEVMAAARLAERLGLDFLLLPDRPGLDPIALAAALAATTTGIGLIPALTAPFHQPYNLGRRLGSIDHISRGRFGWMLKPLPEAEEARRFANVPLPEPEVAAAHAAEMAEVIAGLWDSWDDDAFMRDKASGMYFDRARFHWLNHEGARYRVRGPLDTARPPQGRPPMAALGGSAAGEALAVLAAEFLLSAATSRDAARSERAALATRLGAAGRAEGSLKILPGIAPVTGPTAVPSGAAPVALTGTSEAVAGQIAAWFRDGDADGFVLHLPDASEASATTAAGIVGALAGVGLREAASPSATLRTRLNLAPAPSRYAATAA